MICPFSLISWSRRRWRWLISSSRNKSSWWPQPCPQHRIEAASSATISPQPLIHSNPQTDGKVFQGCYRECFTGFYPKLPDFLRVLTWVYQVPGSCSSPQNRAAPESFSSGTLQIRTNAAFPALCTRVEKGRGCWGIWKHGKKEHSTHVAAFSCNWRSRNGSKLIKLRANSQHGPTWAGKCGPGNMGQHLHICIDYTWVLLWHLLLTLLPFQHLCLQPGSLPFFLTSFDCSAGTEVSWSHEAYEAVYPSLT